MSATTTKRAAAETARRRAREAGVISTSPEMEEAVELEVKRRVAKLQAHLENGSRATNGDGAGAVVDLAALLAPRRFNPSNPPPDPVPLYRLGGIVIATPGNLMGIQAKAKTGKTALKSGLHGAALGGAGDCLGISAENPNCYAVIDLDTEQSETDHYKVGIVTARRAGVPVPAWFWSYRLVGTSLEIRRRVIHYVLAEGTAKHKGVHSLTLDGIADFVADPNDPLTAFAFIEELHGLAEEFKTVIICILHENPGSENGKTRGHLGSQLERKAETNLRLAKDGDVVTIFSERSRSAHIPKEQGLCFQWSEEARMHVLVEGVATVKASAKRAEWEEFAAEVFQHVPAGMGLTWGQAVDRCAEVAHIGRDGGIKRFNVLQKAGVIRKGAGGKWMRA